MTNEDNHQHYIEFRHVDKTFDRPVLKDINFYVDAGQTLAIIGRSGVGKSVSLSHIMGFIKPDRGEIIVAFQNITPMPEAELRNLRRKVTMVFQSGALFDSLSVGENILFSLELRQDYNEQNKEDVVDGLLKMVDLLDYKDAFPNDLSTGYKRAVAIARALAAQPECILYDEPTTMVDPIMSDDLGNLMLRLKKATWLDFDRCNTRPRSDAQSRGYGHVPIQGRSNLLWSRFETGRVLSSPRPAISGNGPGRDAGAN